MIMSLNSNYDKLDEFNLFNIINKKYKEKSNMEKSVYLTTAGNVSNKYCNNIDYFIKNSDMANYTINYEHLNFKSTLANDTVVNYLCDHTISDIIKMTKQEKAKRKREENEQRHFRKEQAKKWFKKVHINKDKRTICVVWADNTKTIVKCHEEDNFDPFVGLCIAIAKKELGNQGYYNDILNDLINEALQ